METKKLQEKSGIFRRVLICVFACVILAVFFLQLNITAASSSEDYTAENRERIEAHLSEIGKEIAKYTAKDTSDGGEISDRVANVINAQRKELIDLQTHEEIGERPMNAEIDLAFTKSTSAGQIAWIYFYHTAKITNTDSLSAIEAAYNTCLETIKQSTAAAVLEKECIELCADLNSAVYTQKIILLERENDSPWCLGYIEKAAGKAMSTRDGELDAPTLCALYDETKATLELQRARDALCEELEDVFLIVRPNESFYSNKKIALFLIELNNSQTVPKMNEAARIAIRDILPQTNGSYADIFISKINLAAADAALRANEANEKGNFLPIFKDYTLKLKKALAKDEIAALLLEEDSDEELKAIEQKFNGDGGIIDFCENAKQVDSEISRAECKKDIYSKYRSAMTDLDIILAPYDKASAQEKLKNHKNTAQKEIDLLSREVKTFDENCELLLKRTSEEFDAVLNDAKAQRFLLDNKAIITKPQNEITKSDENSLRAALVAYIKLEPDVHKLLSGQIDLIAEKYKSALSDKIRSLRADDTLYKDICVKLTSEIKGLSTKSAEAFYKNCDLVLKKADVLLPMFDYYRAIYGSTLYSSYSKEEKDSLSKACNEGAADLSAVDIADPLDLEGRLNTVLRNTILKFDRIDCAASVRIAARDSKNINIQKLVADANSLIFASSDTAEMRSLAELTVFKINRLLTADAIIEKCEGQKYAIGQMKFLTAEEKTIFAGRLDTIKKNFADQATLCENLTVLSFVWDSFSTDFSAVTSEAGQKDLSRSRENYSDTVKKDLSALEGEIGAMAHLSKSRKDEILASALSINAKFATDLLLCENSDEVAKLYESISEQLGALRLSASAENLENYRNIIKSEIDKLLPLKENYSEQSYKKILDIAKKYKDKLSACAQLSDCTALLDEVKKEIEKVPDLLDDAKAEALAALGEALELCTNNSSLYSAENLALAKRLYDEAVKNISAFSEISSISELNASLSQSLALLNAVPRDVIFSQGGEGLLVGTAKYPLDYDFAKKGFWARIYSAGAIDPFAALMISQFKLGDNVDELEELIHEALEDGTLKIYGSPSDKTLNLLKKCVISMGIDIALSKVSPDAKGYSLQMLLPDSLREENVLGFVFIDENGRTEFYSIKQRDMLISLELSHLSRYYVVVEKTTDLTPLLIFLIILLVFEAVAFCFILFLRYNRKRKDKNMLPTDYFYGFSPFFTTFALKVKPNNAVTLSVLLALAALALGCAVAFLAKAELKELKSRKQALTPTKRAPSTAEDDSQKALKSAKKEALPKGEEIPVLCAAFANEEDIQAFVLNEEPSFEESSDLNTESKGPLHRAEINLDVIAKKFKAGELVTPEALKQKKLISQKSDYVKILARGTLKKPLIIEAHDFSRAAEEMLISVGGEAIRIES